MGAHTRLFMEGCNGKGAPTYPIICIPVQL